MCRLFGMTAGRERVRATFWLLEAPDSLAQESRRNPDGTGLGYYDGSEEPVVVKQPLAAYEDQAFAQETREVSSRIFVAHVRYASGTPVTLRNTHPFVQAGRLFAHNGVIGDLPELERHLETGCRWSAARPTPSATSRSSPGRSRSVTMSARDSSQRPPGSPTTCPCSR
jgi:glutamine amidotransferase